MKLTIIAGARPNFIKIAPIIHAILKFNERNEDKAISFRLVHTGQHYDEKLSSSFFKDLDIPEPAINLGVGSGSHAVQTATILIKIEEEFLKHSPDYVLVVGDVNSTMACTLAAKKLNIKVIHVEAGLRSYDLTMPEEINRMVTDALADLFFTTTPEAGYNLVEAGNPKSKIYFIGNTMIDSLIAQQEKLIRPELLNNFDLHERSFFLMTLHRPSNVDIEEKLEYLIKIICENAEGRPVIFPVHPRTRAKLNTLTHLPKNLHLTDPLPYLEFMYLIKRSFAIITDSGGIQEESTYLQIPCITLRENTERPETVSIGTNELVGGEKEAILKALYKLNKGKWKKGRIPELWDGKASERLIDILTEIFYG